MEENKQETKQEPINAIARVEELLKRLDEREKALNEREKVLADQMLAGTAGGGIVPKPEMTEEQKKKQSAIDFWKGTGIDKAIEKYNG